MARWLVSDGTNAQEVQADAAKVAVGGVVKKILRACVADGGVVRQFWPPTATTTNPGIVWNTTAIAVRRTVVDPANAIASIVFSRDFGTYTYKNSPDADVTALYLNPPATAAGQYLIRVDQLSGTALTGTLATWIDLYAASLHTWSLDQIVVGVLNASANISISEDNGGGSPVAATTVVKAVTFRAEVTSLTKIAWTTDPYALVEIREGEDADCILTFTPNGWAVGDAFTSGSFTENWHQDAPDLSNAGIIDRDGELIVDSESVQINTTFNAADFTVTATLSSGTAPTGSALGVALTLDAIREWTLLATTGENLTCSLNVVVSDGTTSVTKVISMNSQRTTLVPEPDWDTTGWSCTDAGYPQPLSSQVFVHLTFAADGSAKLEMESFVMPITTFETGTWLSGFTGDLNDYECMIDSVAGGGITTGQTAGIWYRMAEVFTIEYATLNPLKTRTLNASVRKVGGLATTKVITVTVIAASGGAPA